ACLGLRAMWVRSYWRTDAFDLRITLAPQGDGSVLWRHVKLWSSRGGFILRWERHWYRNAQPTRKRMEWITAEPGTYYDHHERWRALWLFEVDFGARGHGRVDAWGEDVQS